jgi:hypothetical protein
MKFSDVNSIVRGGDDEKLENLSTKSMSIKVDALLAVLAWDGWLLINERRKGGGGQTAEPAEVGVVDVPL